MKELIPVERIENKIYLIRGQKVMLDKDLAGLYEVATKALNKAVARNLFRFPADFMFQLSREEFANLKFQFGTSSWGGTRKLPRVFTEQGIAMLSSVLRSRRAVLVNIEIMRTFTRLKQILLTHKDLELKLTLLEQKFGKHLKKHDAEIQLVFNAIRQLMIPPEKPKGKIGFIVD
ncbi:DNA-binding protein [candidate division WOR-1 bacterium RIFOXYA12_FULL_52_29]|uniref:DNA-binding protein n=1 Tax=candidate division WOR-1 bacterium RIFOXYC12_FULL_54_18 TaxID=1802584 RepID=A0A1F4T6M0_UNCSA|nr:MAG: DNA-binding protein [candidate division WOR-1 bacterium RIFOXYA2_FULL_51_19]OGC17948.1 MAG: DNA-binding protein [candidate division WOR-1 bacterium RIFOXYA12_FULL_52_29]OGC26805.1 MAG: DNA-binding protein [candidate division WOR-1 bacterium RIFOXYB2_FULL_45_9]OGC28365.1 MAG: DNA-binding protein [candidate division WOR-1 bacterium RIFOXYC12_FULL_54_18]OGC31179.1 MAG: DNA-binding protein [candidate division WOR-1 bacterium RIFOXYB12_FULL_52_16]